MSSRKRSLSPDSYSRSSSRFEERRRDNTWFRDPGAEISSKSRESRKYDKYDRHDNEGRGKIRPSASSSRRDSERSERDYGREKSSSYRKSPRDRSRDRVRDKERRRSRSRSHDRRREKERERERGRDKDRDRDRERERDRKQNDSSRKTDREEGELSPSPVPRTAPLPKVQSLSPTSPPQASTIVDMEGITESKKELTEEEILAERRRKREMIMAKYLQPTSGIQSQTTSRSESPSVIETKSVGIVSPTKALTIDEKRLGSSLKLEVTGEGSDGEDTPAMDGDFDLAKESDITADVTREGREASVSAADYDPDKDRREDDARQMQKEGGPINASEDVFMNEEDEEESGEEECLDEEFDMFAEEIKPKKKRKGAKKGVPVIDRAQHTTGIRDDFDDAEGYYRILIGELLDDGRYHVHANLGKGMFANVVRARDQHNSNNEVAIKVIRSQESMYKAGLKEANILRKLMESDPTDKKHVVRLERTFEHRGHLCLVFESLSMNLREVVKRFGKDLGLNLRAVRAYAHQLLLALSLLKKCDIMHADIKPDNILVNENKSTLKLCDLGSASDVLENEITPYLVSRFYRAPEIILGLPYDPALDMWSIGCTLYELYTGKILFPGKNNNHMLQLHMELKGRFSTKLLKKARFVDQHFDEQMNFIGSVYDKITGSVQVQKLSISKPTLDVKGRLIKPPATKKLNPQDLQMLTSFCDLIEKMLTLEASRRITPKEALSHPFIRGV